MRKSGFAAILVASIGFSILMTSQLKIGRLENVVIFIFAKCWQNSTIRLNIEVFRSTAEGNFHRILLNSFIKSTP